MSNPQIKPSDVMNAIARDISLREKIDPTWHSEIYYPGNERGSSEGNIVVEFHAPHGAEGVGSYRRLEFDLFAWTKMLVLTSVDMARTL